MSFIIFMTVFTRHKNHIFVFVNLQMKMDILRLMEAQLTTW